MLNAKLKCPPKKLLNKDFHCRSWVSSLVVSECEWYSKTFLAILALSVKEHTIVWHLHMPKSEPYFPWPRLLSVVSRTDKHTSLQDDMYSEVILVKRPNRMQSLLFSAGHSWSFRISYHIVWPWNFESFTKCRNESSFGRGLSAVPVMRCMYILSAISLTGSSNIFEHLVWMWPMRNSKCNDETLQDKSCCLPCSSLV